MDAVVKVFESSEGNVWKYVFDFGDAIAEAILYRYDSFIQRTVLCVSVQCGCPVGCSFCGTGKRFIRNLTPEEISYQVDYILDDKSIDGSQVKKFQIMFMSMGEPFLNYDNVEDVLVNRFTRNEFENCQLLISTIAPRKIIALSRFTELCKNDTRIGLQFSIHEAIDEIRDDLIPYKNKLSLNEIRNYGVEWWKETGRKPYCNYCLNGENGTENEFQSLVDRFPPNVFCFTFSVICSSDESMKDASYREMERLREFEGRFILQGYDTRLFDPAGQDDIGGGCGQLFHVQRWFNNN